MQLNVALKDYTTMHLGGTARALSTVRSVDELMALVQEAEKQRFPILVLGDGSNVIVGDKGFSGLVILNRITGFDVIQDDPSFAVIAIGAGESWDVTVGRTTVAGLSGIEALSAIPGRVGASPIQNIGAYGQEIADTLIAVEAYDTLGKQFVTIKNNDCNFSYRKSIFNTTDKHRYIITKVILQLQKKNMEPPFYSSLQQHLDDGSITDYSPASIRTAVTELRATKLPDPSVLPNTGSFFKNPLIEKWQADNLRKEYNNPPIYDMGDDTYKVAAGWLIEESDLRGYVLGSMRVYDKNALVLVNDGAQSYQELFDIREHIVDTVRDIFRITLEQEPEEIGV